MRRMSLWFRTPSRLTVLARINRSVTINPRGAGVQEAGVEGSMVLVCSPRRYSAQLWATGAMKQTERRIPCRSRLPGRPNCLKCLADGAVGTSQLGPWPYSFSRSAPGVWVEGGQFPEEEARRTGSGRTTSLYPMGWKIKRPSTAIPVVDRGNGPRRSLW